MDGSWRVGLDPGPADVNAFNNGYMHMHVKIEASVEALRARLIGACIRIGLLKTIDLLSL